MGAPKDDPDWASIETPDDFKALGKDGNTLDSNGRTYLYRVSKFCSKPVVETALAMGGKVDVEHRSKTPLFVATRSENVGAVEALLAAGANPNIETNGGCVGQSHLGVKRGLYSRLNATICNIFFVLFCLPFHRVIPPGRHLTHETGRLAAWNELWRMLGVDSLRTAVFFEARANNSLIYVHNNLRCNSHQTTDFSNTTPPAARTCLLVRHCTGCKTLLMTPLTICDRYTPLWIAARDGFVDIVTKLIVAGADPNHVQEITLTNCLMIACSEANEDTALAICAAPTLEVDATDMECGSTALWVCFARKFLVIRPWKLVQRFSRFLLLYFGHFSQQSFQ